MTTKHFIRGLFSLSLIIPWTGRCSAGGVAATYDDFMRLAADSEKAEAINVGDRLFKVIVVEKPDNAALALLAKRLETAQRIGAVPARGAGSSQAKLLEGIAGLDDLGLTPPATPKEKEESALLLPSARQMYWSHIRVFTGELTLDSLPAQQATFLRRYYELRMQDSIMKIARQVIVGDPNSPQNASCAVVLPLLYLNGKDNAWDEMKPLLALFSSNQLDILSKFSLLEAERPQAAMAISQRAAQAEGREFSMRTWALAAADTCVANHRPDLAEKALYTAMGGVKDKGEVAELRVKMAEGYAQCSDYATAAQKCRQITTDFPDTPLFGKIMAIYFGYLAREGKAEQVAAETESALQDARCKPYLAQILYLRWWALCKNNRQEEAARLAQQLIDQYANNSCVAPVMLERATDALARQDYEKCRELLARLTKDFPGTESAKRAQDILVRMEASVAK